MFRTTCLLLTLCTSGCIGYALKGSYTVSLDNEQEGMARISGGIDTVIGPKTESSLDRKGRFRFEHIDLKAPCHYGWRIALSSQFNGRQALLGPSLGTYGYCQIAGPVSASAHVDIKPFELGIDRRQFAFGAISPHSEIGLRVSLAEGAALEAFGQVGYDFRPLDTRSMAYAGGGLRLTLGLLP